METTRRGFLGRALAGLAALTAPVAAAKAVPKANEGDIWATPSSEFDDYSPRDVLSQAVYAIDPAETPFMAFCKGKYSPQFPRHEWIEDELVSAIDVRPNPDPLFRLMGRKARE